MPAIGSTAPARRASAELLAEARARTLLLVSPLSEPDMQREDEQGLGSVLSELERILRFELETLLGESLHQPVTSYDGWFDLMGEVRERVLHRLEAVDPSDEPAQLGRVRMVLEHEYQRNESILEILQNQGEPYQPLEKRKLPRGRRLADPGMMVRFPGGTVLVGASESVWPQECPSHQLKLPPFWIDITPVTNGDFMTFMGEGGYESRELWSEPGWRWLRTSHERMPRHWSWQDGLWWCRSLGRDAAVDFTAPVIHVSYYEAEAFARFVGKRLPSEFEWEAAAGWDPETQTRRQFPWGNMQPTPHVANLDQLAFAPASVGAFPGNISPIGCYGMIGDAWEWTASDFLPYPNSEPWPGNTVGELSPGVKVLRGGSWATRAGAVRVWTRRALPPEARHVFAGFRCARDG
ncbi:MAG TPA: SUMF1/EgtB/PvdO family nonheme iron enzyme [Gemmatimonadales bacterium]|nr:SUMF1/EgtB/PvdO family nonheme iron enzyme [Gemmatimonadales bacterium]